MYTAGQVVREAQSCNSHFLDVRRTVYLAWPTLSICLILGLVEEKKKDEKKSLCFRVKKHGVRTGQGLKMGEHGCAALWGRKACVASATHVHSGEGATQAL